MSKFEEWRKYLNDLRRNPANEIKFKNLKKWMIDELGVQQLKSKSGSHFPYSHPKTGTFRIPLADNKTLYRKNFLGHTYGVLMGIIDALELEENDE